MTFSINDMIARCIERMRGGACATCDNRALCPAGRWQQAFGPPREARRNKSSTGGPARLFAFLNELADTLAPSAPRKRCFKAEVESAIEPLLGSREVSIDRVARELGMSRQTLYRRLKAEGTTFEELLDAKRRQLAVRYLGLDRSSVKAAAYRLGFSDPAAFSRAFKRWTGIRPSDFRAAPVG